MNAKKIIILCALLVNFHIVFAEGYPVKPSESVFNNPPWLIREDCSSITISDDIGKRVIVKKQVQKIVAIGPTMLFITLRALGAEDRVVGISDWISREKTILPVMFNKSNIVQTSGVINYEKIYEINPDIVVIIAPFVDEDIDKKLASAIPVVRLKPNNLKSITKLGKIIDREKEALEYVKWIVSKTSVIEKRVATLEKDEIKDIFFYYGGDYGISPPPPYGTYGKDNYWVNDTIKKVGGRSISWALPGEWITVDPEWIIEKNPAFIIREYFVMDSDPAMGYEVNTTEKVEKMVKNLISRPVFANSNAVKNKEVHIFYGQFIQTYWFIGLNYYAKLLHPDLFKDIDPEAVHQEFLSKFLRLDYDLKKHGVFTYSYKGGSIPDK